MSNERTGVAAVRLITEPLEIPKKLNKLGVMPVISVLWILRLEDCEVTVI